MVLAYHVTAIARPGEKYVDAYSAWHDNCSRIWNGSTQKHALHEHCATIEDRSLRPWLHARANSFQNSFLSIIFFRVLTIGFFQRICDQIWLHRAERQWLIGVTSSQATQQDWGSAQNN